MTAIPLRWRCPLPGRTDAASTVSSAFTAGLATIPGGVVLARRLRGRA